MSLLCLLGFHRWKEVYRWTDYSRSDALQVFMSTWGVWVGMGRYYKTGRKVCRCCGKAVQQ